ncbi:hypothetical protein I6E29_02925 [Arcanobacterium haemolyticum]|nr:hypothetical protein [Arcanobacterium haemolyticum]
MKKLIALVAALVLCLAGCKKTSGDSTNVTIEGALGAPVTISLGNTSFPQEISSRIVLTGDGNTVHAGSPVLLRATSFDSRSGDIIESYETGNLRLTTADSAGLGELATHVVGATEGSRILVTRPGLSASDPDAVEIVVVDILYTTAHGNAAPTPASVPAGMPTIELADGGGPAITAPGGAIPSLNTVVLVQGAGAQVSASSRVAIQYVIADSSGNIIDTTWNGAGPAAVDLADVMEGLRLGLADQKVRSRVVVLIPSAQASGDGDRVAIVDILAVMDQ